MSKIRTAEEILNDNLPYGHKWSAFLLPDQLVFFENAIKQAQKETILSIINALKNPGCNLFEHVVNEDIANFIKEELFKQIEDDVS